MLSNIFFIEYSEGSGTHRIWKCLMNLGVKADLPPPGGAAEQIVMNLSMFLKKKAGLS
jgi:hypothetical protein